MTDAQFAKIAPHLPTGTRGKARVDDRRVISGIVHVLKSGGRSVDAPSVYGPRKTLCDRFVRWAAKGVWVRLFQALAQVGGPPAHVLMDSSAVKAHRSAAGGKGRNKAPERAFPEVYLGLQIAWPRSLCLPGTCRKRPGRAYDASTSHDLPVPPGLGRT